MNKIIRTNNNSYDVFFGDGWDNCVRVRKTKTAFYAYSRYGVFPSNYLKLAEDMVKSLNL
ncbi:hypothetical protein UFOVP22_37 [uncultured Caudovirales phage]|uniref:Uncharacterized protein n=1 Tax=uncultured Caudovirales phage TaxID=2100421 RepID=A0A6J5T9Z1_9CAUD|nr:hypothetical protein UFOVP22_37 [uncultured Caudovirales phage]